MKNIISIRGFIGLPTAGTALFRFPLDMQRCPPDIRFKTVRRKEGNETLRNVELNKKEMSREEMAW